MIPSRSSVLAAVWLAAVAATLPAQQGQLPAPLRPGPHPVGFTIHRIADSSRPYGDSAARPIPLYLWYPAAARGATMRYRDYVEEPVERFVARLEQEPDKAASAEAIRALLDLPMLAHRDARPLGSRYPLVLFGNGMNGPVYLYTVLGEYLATQGYAVAAIPSFGLVPGKPLSFDTVGIRTQIADLELALDAAWTMPFVDSARTALAAWSVGGVSTAVLATKRPAVRALLSLDAATGYDYGLELLTQLGHPGAEGFRTPYMHLKGAREGRFVVPRTDAFFRGLSSADAYEVTVPDLAHHHFTVSLGLLSPSVRDAADWRRVQESTATSWRYALAFLDRYLKDARGGGEYLRSARPGPGGAVVRAQSASRAASSR